MVRADRHGWGRAGPGPVAVRSAQMWALKLSNDKGLFVPGHPRATAPRASMASLAVPCLRSTACTRLPMILLYYIA